jgi:hypothetical protein
MTAKQSAIQDILQSEVKNLLSFEKALIEFNEAYECDYYECVN